MPTTDTDVDSYGRGYADVLPPPAPAAAAGGAGVTDMQRRMEALGLTVDAPRMKIVLPAFVRGAVVDDAAFFGGGFMNYVTNTRSRRFFVGQPVLVDAELPRKRLRWKVPRRGRRS